jgi:predicted nucleic acid-binding protein
MLLTPLGEVEAFNAMQLRVFRKEISSQQAEDSAHHFEYDLQAGVYRRSSLPDSAFERARQLSRQLTARLGTRTADLLHVAAALELGATSFFSFDLQQRKMAEAVGLKLNTWP